MPINVNCTSFRHGDCLHQAAPRRWFGPARCIVWLAEMGTDPRLRVKCALCTPHPKPQRLVIPQAGWITVEGVPPAPASVEHPPRHP